MGLNRWGTSLLPSVVVVLGAAGMIARNDHNWPRSLAAVLPGDIMLGAIFPVHESSVNFSDCGRIQLEDGIQPLEALLYTVTRINSEKILPFKLGVIALDSCDNVVHALEQSLDFIKGFLSKVHNNERRFTCSDGSTPKYGDGDFEKVIGVIGGQTSTVSIQVANVLRLFHVPQISYLSTSPSLSNKEMYNYFFRTVPSDINQAQIILEVLREFDWTYASLVYTNNDYGNKGFEELQKLAPRYNVCLALPQHISVEHHRPSDYDAIVRNLLHKTNARVVVVYADKRSAQKLMEASKNHADERRFVWVGSDGWSARETVTKGLEKVIEGAITVQPMWGELAGFDEYFTSLRPQSSTSSNPWFDEFWEEFFKCRLADKGPKTPFNDYPKLCKPNLNISSTKRYKQQTYLHFVRDTAYSFAYALRDLNRDKCGNSSKRCAEMDQYLDGQQLKKYIQNVTFKDELGKTFRFLENGDGPLRYSILNFQQNSKGNYSWSDVGNYIMGDDGQPRLTINKSKLKFAGGSIPTSYCSSPCLAGQIKIKQDGDNCCWVCANCSTYQYLVDEFQCQECPWGTLPTESKNMCQPIDAIYMHYGNPYAISAMVLAGMGMVLTCAIAIIFSAYNDTPVIKAAGRELSYLLLGATLLSFALTFILVARPSRLMCGLTRFSLGLCYTLCYGAVVTKTNRIARIFNARHGAPSRTRYTSPKSQIIITMLITSVEVLINGTWLAMHPPDIIHVHPSREENVLICAGSEDASYLVGLIYPLILIGFCTVYAFKTRKCPDGFNEARYVAFTNYTTCVIWLAFVPLFFASGNNLKRTITLSLSLSLSGTVQLGCLFVPKIYIVLLKPEKNTKENVMNQHRSAYIHSSSIGCGTTSPSIQVNGITAGHTKTQQMIPVTLPVSVTSSTICTSPASAMTTPNTLSAITKFVASSDIGFIVDGVSSNVNLKNKFKHGHRKTL